jgi:hypothetical protein
MYEGTSIPNIHSAKLRQVMQRYVPHHPAPSGTVPILVMCAAIVGLNLVYIKQVRGPCINRVRRTAVI